MDKYPQYRETSMAMLEIKLPQNQAYLKKTHLDITAYELKEQIRKDCGLQDLHLILKGKNVSFEKRLDEQNVKNNSKIMVQLVSSENERNKLLEYEKEKRSADEGVQRTQRGIQILSERQSTEGPTITPFLEITDQEGNMLQISEKRDRDALMMAMGFHEKGRALIKNRRYEAALPYLQKAEEHFDQCDPTILNALDNFAILQLDIVWCYQRLNKSNYLIKAEQRLRNAERCFQKCYGDQHRRLQQIKKHTGGEDVLLLRLNLLQSCVAFYTCNYNQASALLNKVQDLYNHLHLDPEKLNQLTLTWGFSDREARLGLRACRENINEAVKYLTLREEKKSEWWRRHLQDVNTLVEMDYSRGDAAIALRFAKGDLDEAFRILLDRAEGQTSDTTDEMGVTDLSLRLIEDLTQRERRESKKKRQHLQDVNRLVDRGYSREDAAIALCCAEGDFHEAYKILLDHEEGQTSDTTDEMDMGLMENLTQREDRERERRQHLQDVNRLVVLGYSREDAAIALCYTEGDSDEAFRLLLDHEEGQTSDTTDEMDMGLMENLTQREDRGHERRRHLQDINTLVVLGYSREDAAIALCYAEGDSDEAFRILLDHEEGQTSDTADEMGVTHSSLGLIEYLTQREEREHKRRRHLQNIKTLVELGYSSEDVAIALLAKGDLDEAFRTLLDREERQISGTTDEMTEEPDPPSFSRYPNEELVNEILKDIPRHVDDHLDLTLEEEQELMINLQSELKNYNLEKSLQVEGSVIGL